MPKDGGDACLCGGDACLCVHGDDGGGGGGGGGGGVGDFHRRCHALLGKAMIWFDSCYALLGKEMIWTDRKAEALVGQHPYASAIV